MHRHAVQNPVGAVREPDILEVERRGAVGHWPVARIALARLLLGFFTVAFGVLTVDTIVDHLERRWAQDDGAPAG